MPREYEIKLPPYDPETEDNPLHDWLPFFDDIAPRAQYTSELIKTSDSIRLTQIVGFSKGDGPVEFSIGHRRLRGGALR